MTGQYWAQQMKTEGSVLRGWGQHGDHEKTGASWKGRVLYQWREDTYEMNGKEGESNKTKAENVTIYEEFSFQDIPCSGQQL